MSAHGTGGLLFEALTPLGFVVRVTRSRWHLIVSSKHPVMDGHEADVRGALETPAEIRQSRRVITAYPTDAIKEGDRIWPK